MIDTAKAAYAVWRGSHRESGAPAHWDDLGDVWRAAFECVFMYGRLMEQDACAKVAEHHFSPDIGSGPTADNIARAIRAKGV